MLFLKNKTELKSQKGRGMAQYWTTGDVYNKKAVVHSIILFGDGVKLTVETVSERDPKVSWSKWSDSVETHMSVKLDLFPVQISVSEGHSSSTFGCDRWDDHLMFKECIDALNEGSIKELVIDGPLCKKKGISRIELETALQEKIPQMLKLFEKFQKVTGIKSNEDLTTLENNLVKFAEENVR